MPTMFKLFYDKIKDMEDMIINFLEFSFYTRVIYLLFAFFMISSTSYVFELILHHPMKN